MNELTFIQRNDVFTDTWIIAQNIGYAHKSIVRHITKHRERFKSMGGTYYSHRVKSGGGRDIKPINLNEAQAIFLMTLLDNTDRVLDFKQELAMEFVRMRRRLLERQTTDWQQARLESKDFRKLLNENIKELIPYAISQGSTHPDKLYVSYSAMIKKICGYADLDMTDRETLNTVTVMIRVVRGVLLQEMALGTYYKTIFQKAKAQLAAIMPLWRPMLTV